MIQGTLIQIILFIKDMARAVGFYRDLLGFQVVYPQGLSDYSQEMWVELEVGGCSIALHGGAKNSPGEEHQLIFKVADLEAAREELLTAGIEIGEIRILEDGKPVASGVDPEGHRFSIR